MSFVSDTQSDTNLRFNEFIVSHKAWEEKNLSYSENHSKVMSALNHQYELQLLCAVEEHKLDHI